MSARARKVWSDAELLLRAAQERFRAWEKNTRELRLASDALRDRGQDDRADFLQAVAGIADRMDGLGGGAGFGTCQVGRRGVRVWWVIRARKGRPAERRCLWVCWLVAG